MDPSDLHRKVEEPVGDVHARVVDEKFARTPQVKPRDGGVEVVQVMVRPAPVRANDQPVKEAAHVAGRALHHVKVLGHVMPKPEDRVNNQEGYEPVEQQVERVEPVKDANHYRPEDKEADRSSHADEEVTGPHAQELPRVVARQKIE